MNAPRHQAKFASGSAFARLCRWLFCLGGGLLGGFLVPTLAQARLDTLVLSGPTAVRVNLVVISEGYTLADLAHFPQDAMAAAESLLTTSPYSSYRSYFNVFALSVPSLESGSDHPSRGLFANTYFNSTYDSFGGRSVLTIPPNDYDPVYEHGEGKVIALLQQFLPEYDLVLILVNDPAYGGSGGTMAITSLDPQAREIAVHELGHTIAGLGDEYESAFPGFPDTEEPNTTQETRREFIKWNAWIDSSTPVPTPVSPAYTNVVGLFLGAHYHTSGWYRPRADCKMRSLGRPFCEICAEALVLSLYNYVTPLETVLPASPALVMTNDALSFLAQTQRPAVPVRLQWYVDGVPQQGATNEQFVLDAPALSPGSHSVWVSASDPTPLVRRDTLGALRTAHVWTVQRIAAGIFQLEMPSVRADGSVRVVVPAWTSGSSVLQGSVDARAWTDLQTNPAAVSWIFTNAGPAQPGQRFFRARVDP